MKGVVRHPKKASFSVTVVDQTRQRLPLAFFRTCANKSLDVLGAHSGSSIGIVFVENVLMRKLNARYRKKARTTNVLAFSYKEGFSGHKKNIVGDIILCVPEVRREAKLLGRTLKTHLAVLLVHGMVHLAGYDHSRSLNTRRMEAVEKRILQKLGLS